MQLMNVCIRMTGWLGVSVAIWGFGGIKAVATATPCSFHYSNRLRDKAKEMLETCRYVVELIVSIVEVSSVCTGVEGVRDF